MAAPARCPVRTRRAGTVRSGCLLGRRTPLLAAWPGDDLIAEYDTGSAQSLGLSRDVIDDEVDPVPSTGRGYAAVRHRPAEVAGPDSSSRRLPRVTSANAGA
jgi:hypothetical protein